VVPVILGLLALALVLWLAKSYIKVDPGLLKRYGRKIGGYASFAAAAPFALRKKLFTRVTIEPGISISA